MNIRIHKLTIDNFKCFKHKEFVFENDVVTIKGRNGAGKTTIADAILWCLFGKNSAGQSDFNLKTYDENGNPIPHLDHSVELELNCDFGYVSLKRVLKETWIKKRGSDEQVFKNNTTEYFVNGEVYTAGDYKKYIAQLVDEEVFKCITNPSYFPSLKWQVQREFLSKMAGDIEPLDDSVGFVALNAYLRDNNQDLITYRKHLSYQIKGIKDKLEKIPVRLEEQNKALPESLDYDTLQTELDNTKKEFETVNEKIVAIKSGNGGDVLREEIRGEIKSCQSKLDLMEGVVRSKVRDLQSEHDNKVSELGRKFSQILNNQKDIEQTLPSFDKMIERCNEVLKQCELDADDIRRQWADNLARTISFNASEQFCPTCGQLLPDEKQTENREKAIAQLNESKANTKAELTKRAEKVKATRADAEQQIKDIEAKKAEAEQRLAETKEAINTAFSDKQKAEKEPVVTLEQALADDAEYRECLAKKEELKKKLDSVCVSEEDTSALEELNAKKLSLSDSIQTLTTQLATRDMRLKILALIDGIEDEQKDLVTQLSELERKEDVARSYQDRQNAILEERINEHFSLVKWRMFRTVNNGGDPFDEPFCECYVDGVAYHDGLNQAARLNAGLDIIKTLCKHYGVSAPILVDNSESNLNILSTESQQVRLEVAGTDLQIL